MSIWENLIQCWRYDSKIISIKPVNINSMFLTNLGWEIRPRIHSKRGRSSLSYPRQLRGRRSSRSFRQEVHGDPEIETSSWTNRRRRRVRRSSQPDRPSQLRLPRHRGRLNRHPVSRNETGDWLWSSKNIFFTKVFKFWNLGKFSPSFCLILVRKK